MKYLFLLFFPFIFLSAIAQEKLAWDYPVKPGSDEWRNTSYKEKIDRSQPSKDVLKSWTTEILFQYCLDYPFNKVVLLFNNPNDGFERVYEQSTVWQEFVQRENALDIFMSYYAKDTYKELFELKNEEKQNDKLFVLFFLEKLVSETDFVIKYNLQNKRKLVSLILQKHIDKKNYPDEFLGYSFNSSLSAILKVMGNDEIQSQNDISLAKFREITDNEYFVSEDMDSNIIKMVIKYINL